MHVVTTVHAWGTCEWVTETGEGHEQRKTGSDVLFVLNHPFCTSKEDAVETWTCPSLLWGRNWSIKMMKISYVFRERKQADILKAFYVVWWTKALHHLRAVKWVSWEGGTGWHIPMGLNSTNLPAIDLGKSGPKSELSCCCCWLISTVFRISYFCFNLEFVMVCSSVVNCPALFVAHAAEVVRSFQRRAESLRFLLWLHQDWNCAYNHADCVHGSGIPYGHCLNLPLIGEAPEDWAAWILY